MFMRPPPPSLQVLAVLEAMGGTLKADDAELAYKQEKKAKQARSAADLVRVTAMFSATMPPAVEKMAKKYLRHPAVVQVCIKSGERSQVPCTSGLQVFAVVQRPRGKTSQVEGLQTQGQQCARDFTIFPLRSRAWRSCYTACSEDDFAGMEWQIFRRCCVATKAAFRAGCCPQHPFRGCWCPEKM